ncbi:ABC transporter substrate-binding protein [Bradyrhizobium erythrophlei]|uniref:Peptide/nickel transport system substrate-binding protein n=1 Tax=Bradyrhizobium erythrophlei TaxID=1437360 RepID=A0A1M5VBU4_9BRAD|nr:ABC transporter substrate-binding protein [Bradyrhizobium erythrophlei]SHH72666.1 peptide/nickel transport system substrate-binding protein [Bradyrhizobium erythrophlei]
MKRRTFLMGTGATVTAALVGARVALAQHRPDELVWADDLPGSLDPHALSDVPMQGYIINVYDTLYVNQDNPPKLVPWLATGHTVSDDGLIVTFKLHEGVKFHDGSPLTSEDVVWTFHRLLNVKKGPAAAFLTVLDPNGITAPDPTTVVFKLKRPYAPFLAATPLVAILNRRVIEPKAKDNDWGQAWLTSNSAGSGSYILDPTTYQPVQQIDLKRNHDHFMGWGHNKSPIEIVRRRNILETTTRVNALIKGDVDCTDSYLPPDQVERVLASKTATVSKDQSMRVMVLRMNNKKAPFDNLNFRLAMSHAFNYKGFIDGVLKGYAVRNAGPIPVNLWGSPKDLPPYDFNLDTAREFLAKAKAEGAPVDREIEIHIQQHLAQTTQAAQILQQGLRKVGVNLRIVANLWPQIVSSTAKVETTPDMWVHWVSSYFIDPENWIGQMYDSQFHGTWKASCWYKNEKVDTLLREARRLDDQSKRRALYEEASRLVVADAADIWIYNAIELRGLSNRLRGFRFTPIGSGADFRIMSLTS